MRPKLIGCLLGDAEVLPDDPENTMALRKSLLTRDTFSFAEKLFVEWKASAETNEGFVTFHVAQGVNVVLLNQLPICLSGGGVLSRTILRRDARVTRAILVR